MHKKRQEVKETKMGCFFFFWSLHFSPDQFQVLKKKKKKAQNGE